VVVHRVPWPKLTGICGNINAGEFCDLRTDPQEWNNLYGKDTLRAARDRMSLKPLAHLNHVALKKP
jgi:hypothetical protein